MANKMTYEEAGEMGADIFELILKLYAQVDWGEAEGEFLQLKFHKDGRIEIYNHIDEWREADPSVFNLTDLEKNEDS